MDQNNSIGVRNNKDIKKKSQQQQQEQHVNSLFIHINALKTLKRFQVIVTHILVTIL